MALKVSAQVFGASFQNVDVRVMEVRGDPDRGWMARVGFYAPNGERMDEYTLRFPWQLPAAMLSAIETKVTNDVNSGKLPRFSNPV